MNRAWTGLIWYRRGNGWLLWTWLWTFRFHKKGV